MKHSTSIFQLTPCNVAAGSNLRNQQSHLFQHLEFPSTTWTQECIRNGRCLPSLSYRRKSMEVGTLFRVLVIPGQDGHALTPPQNQPVVESKSSLSSTFPTGLKWSLGHHHDPQNALMSFSEGNQEAKIWKLSSKLIILNLPSLANDGDFISCWHTFYLCKSFLFH